MNGLAGRRVLVVEDSYILAMEVKSVLTSAGAQVIGPSASVDTALQMVQAAPPDCAVLDVNLGGGASFILAKVLKEMKIPFLFYTGYDRDVIPEAFADVDRLAKPLDRARLIRAVESCCNLAA